MLKKDTNWLSWLAICLTEAGVWTGKYFSSVVAKIYSGLVTGFWLLVNNWVILSSFFTEKAVFKNENRLRLGHLLSLFEISAPNVLTQQYHSFINFHKHIMDLKNWRAVMGTALGKQNWLKLFCPDKILFYCLHAAQRCKRTLISMFVQWDVPISC